MTATFGVAPAYMQRAAFLGILSFLFFLGMLGMYSVRGNIGYFLLATAFLLIHLIVMFSLVTRRRGLVEVHDRGVKFRNQAIEWDEMGEVTGDGTIVLLSGDRVEIPESVDRRAELLAMLRVVLQNRKGG